MLTWEGQSSLGLRPGEQSKPVVIQYQTVIPENLPHASNILSRLYVHTQNVRKCTCTYVMCLYHIYKCICMRDVQTRFTLSPQTFIISSQGQCSESFCLLISAVHNCRPSSTYWAIARQSVLLLSNCSQHPRFSLSAFSSLPMLSASDRHLSTELP